MSHLIRLDQPIRERHAMWQQFVDDTVVVLGISRGVSVEVGGQQSPGLVCGTEPRIAQLKLFDKFWHHLDDLEKEKKSKYLDSLVLTTDDSWLAASQFQASFWVSSPPNWSLIHLWKNGGLMVSLCCCLNFDDLKINMKLTWRSNPRKLEPDSVWMSDRRTRHSQRVHFGPARPPSLQLMRCLHRRRWERQWADYLIKFFYILSVAIKEECISGQVCVCIPAIAADGGWCWARVRRLRDSIYSFSRSLSSRMSIWRLTAVGEESLNLNFMTVWSHITISDSM